MMISDEKRRKVAQELRKMAVYCDGSLSEWWQRLQDTVTEEVDFADPKKTFRAIADLIEPQRKTCRLVTNEDFIRNTFVGQCTNCGNQFNVYVAKFWDYCPFCGAKVDK